MRVVQTPQLEQPPRHQDGVVGDLVLTGEGPQIDRHAGKLIAPCRGHPARPAEDDARLRRGPGGLHQRRETAGEPLIVVELEGDPASSRELDPLVDPQRRQAAVELVADVHHPRILALQRLDQLERAVDRAVVDDDQLEVAEALREDAVQSELEQTAGTALEGRQDHGDGRRRRRLGPAEDLLIGEEVADEDHAGADLLQSMACPAAAGSSGTSKASPNASRSIGRRALSRSHTARPSATSAPAISPRARLRVLEVGCGTGRVYEQLVPRLLPECGYVGVDVSGRMLAIARKRFPGGRFHQGDGQALALADGTVDYALAFEVLGHLPEIQPLIRELGRVSRRGFLFTAWPAAEEEGIVDSHELVGQARFLRRRYPASRLVSEIAAALPDKAHDVEIAVLGPATWAYVVQLSPQS